MSEISVLSNQYETLVNTSQKINNSIIILKKKDLLRRRDSARRYPKLILSESQYVEAIDILLPFLKELASLFGGGNINASELPLSIMDDYIEKLKGGPYFKEALNRLIANLESNKELESKDIETLDSIISAMDDERTLLFRKLRTARG